MGMPNEHSPVPICFMCTHYRENYHCDAFPDGIPFDVIASNIDHRNEIEGDNGIHFQPISESAVTYAEELFGVDVPGLRPARMSGRMRKVAATEPRPA